ncbi:ParB/RepB/Spo0J family partition protein [Nitrospirillum amazonense]|uniref:ParB/RepB/Spo0J family partition protein n=1 Tax=Nitrospirillum amazonense TaxID=28077 RepID=UPI0024129B4A|nr:ParB/RepB/Spo0J family partition protein [Nitrospirillum amazonense]MDG3444647.1 ParB/RepB/Spo0J family partition protein [Nitrospirillum amazonense]
MATKPKPGMSNLTNILKGAKTALDNKPEDLATILEPIDLEDIEPDPDQPRQHFSDDSIAELAQTIAAEGLLQNIIVRPKPGALNKYIIIIGERRWRAMRLLGWKSTHARVKDTNHMLAQILENEQREDVAPLDKARAYRRYMEIEDLDQVTLAQRVGKKPAEISAILGLLRLAPSVQDALPNSELSLGLLIELSTMKVEDQEALWQEYQKDEFSLTIPSIRRVKSQLRGAAGSTVAEVISQLASPAQVPSPVPAPTVPAASPVAPTPTVEGYAGDDTPHLAPTVDQVAQADGPHTTPASPTLSGQDDADGAVYDNHNPDHEIHHGAEVVPREPPPKVAESGPQDGLFDDHEKTGTARERTEAQPRRPIQLDDIERLQRHAEMHIFKGLSLTATERQAVQRLMDVLDKLTSTR